MEIISGTGAGSESEQPRCECDFYLAHLLYDQIKDTNAIPEVPL